MKLIQELLSASQLSEAPLPDDWDHSKFNGPRNFKKMIAYATEQAKKLGAGSSRVAFEIPYEGRETVLKIAKNQKGLAQNEAEAELFSDWYLKGLGIIVPIIDYDEENEPPRWIHTEKAEKIKNEKVFIDETNVTLYDLVEYTSKIHRREADKYAQTPHYRKVHSMINHDSELVSALNELFASFEHIEYGDLTRLANWGMYKGRPVIIDLGFTTETKKLYFR